MTSETDETARWKKYPIDYIFLAKIFNLPKMEVLKYYRPDEEVEDKWRKCVIRIDHPLKGYEEWTLYMTKET